VLAVSAELAGALPTGSRPAAGVLANGCDPERYAGVDELPPAAEIRLAPPVAGLVGQLNERLDLDMLAAVADRGRSLLLVGPRYEQRPDTRRRLDDLLRRPNVQWTGRVPAERLPEYLAAIDVGLTPYADTAFNRASFPLKTLEYLAAGRPVVSTDLPSARWLMNGPGPRNTELIDLAADAEAFADLVDARLKAPRTPAFAAARRAFASRHSWAARAEELRTLIGPAG